MTAMLQRVPLGNVPNRCLSSESSTKVEPSATVRGRSPQLRTRTGPFVSGREQRCRPDPVIAPKQDSSPPDTTGLLGLGNAVRTSLSCPEEQCSLQSVFCPSVVCTDGAYG